MAATHSPMPSALGVSVSAANTRKWGDTTLSNRQGMHGGLRRFDRPWWTIKTHACSVLTEAVT